MTGLVCPQCSSQYPLTNKHGKVSNIYCDTDFRKLRAAYDLGLVAKDIRKEKIQNRPEDIWRYLELMPIAGDKRPETATSTGFTPLKRADKLAEFLGVGELYLKDDTVNPTGSFKDRGVDVAVARAKELGYETMACVSTGNLAKSTAAYAQKAGMKAYIFVPANLEDAKIAEISQYGANVIRINGSYDDVNLLGGEIAKSHPEIAFVNINFRPYYGDGSKTMGFEIIEQLGWRAPADIVVPIGGALLTTKIGQALDEFYSVGLIEKPNTRIHGVQAEGCSPVADAVINKDNDGKKHDFITPVTPNTTVSSIAIGNPSNGLDALHVIRNSGGYAATASNEDIESCIGLLEKEGVDSEDVGRVVLGAAKKLVKEGRIPGNEGPVVLLMTGHKHKAPYANDYLNNLIDPIDPRLEQFEKIYNKGLEERVS